MLNALKQRVMELLSTSEDQAQDHSVAIQLATATLLAEVARSDGQLDDREQATLREVLRSRFDLSTEDCELVLSDGVASAERSVSLQGFTRTLHEALTADEKVEIVGLLWRIAAADGVLDKHEDARIAQIGELLYVPRAEVLRQKHEAGF